MRWPVADPDAKRECGHRRCRRSIPTGAFLLAAGGAAITAAATYAIATPAETWPAPTAIAGFIVGLAGGAAWCWPHPREWHDDDHWMAIVEATREHPIYADWDTRELTENRNTR